MSGESQLPPKEDVAKPLGTPPTNIPSRTTPEEDRTSASQRRVNIIWEVTQAFIALLVTCTGMYTASTLALRSDPDATSKSAGITGFLFLSNVGFLVIGFYFGRTNHSRTGGVGGEQVKQDR